LLWKGMLEEVFEDVLRFLFKDADRLFDMRRKFEFLDKELVELCPEPDKGSATRVVDKLVKVFRCDGKEEWILVHLEVQERNGKAFPERMFQYFYRLFDKYRRPITAVAIFTGGSNQPVQSCFKCSCLGTGVEYKYNALRIIDYPDEMLEASENPFALVMLTAKKALLTDKMEDEERLKHKLLIAKALLAKKQLSHRKIKAIFVFLNNYVLFKEKETNSIFITEVNRINDKAKSMNIFEQITEMKLEEQNRRVVRNLLKHSSLSMVKIASVVNVPLDFVKKVKKSIRTR